eukprot:g8801.t1
MDSRQSGGFPSGTGLSSRNRPPINEDHLQIHVDGEFDFDREIDGLRSQVGRLKHVTRSIHSEAKEQNQFMDQVSEIMEQSQIALKRASKKLRKVYDQSKGNHLLWLVLFCFGVLFFLWFVSKVHRLVGH